MLTVYINYPNTHITIHRRDDCAQIGKSGTVGQREVRLNRTSISEELAAFAGQQYRFAASAGLNDMYLVVDFEDEAFETAVVEYVRRLLSRRHSPFTSIRAKVHC